MLHLEPIPDDSEIEDKMPKFKVSNGFIVREKRVQDKSCNGRKSDTGVKGLTIAQQRQRHLVLDRDFEDILEACRPRNRGDGPSALLSQLQLFGLVTKKKQNSISNIIEGDEIFESSFVAPKEWNSINLDDPSQSSTHLSVFGVHPDEFSLPKQGSRNKISAASSDCSTYSSQSLSSSFTNNISAMLGQSPRIYPLRNVQIQLSASIDVPSAINDFVLGTMQKSRSNGSLPEEDVDDVNFHRDRSNSIISSCDSASASNFQRKLLSLEAMRKAMDYHDSTIIYHEPEVPDVAQDNLNAQTKVV